MEQSQPANEPEDGDGSALGRELQPVVDHDDPGLQEIPPPPRIILPLPGIDFPIGKIPDPKKPQGPIVPDNVELPPGTWRAPGSREKS